MHIYDNQKIIEKSIRDYFEKIKLKKIINSRDQMTNFTFFFGQQWVILPK